jgi:hypothetical protein
MTMNGFEEIDLDNHLPAGPGWRNVLRQITAHLKDAGIDHKVVGGASAALHGVEMVVKDVDIEMDAADAYRFQDLFAERVVSAVEFREGEAYRSHFGAFDFDGVRVEVMGDLERREGGRWVSTRCTTEDWIDLEGATVSASWLEEETLAAIRRGRMERAAQYLMKCDQGRLLALLRGEKKVGVL